MPPSLVANKLHEVALQRVVPASQLSTCMAIKPPSQKFDCKAELQLLPRQGTGSHLMHNAPSQACGRDVYSALLKALSGI